MRLGLLALSFLLAILCLVLPASGADQAQSAAAQVTVTAVTLDPEVFIAGDTGTITVEVMNNGSQSVAVRRATLVDPDIRVLSQAYDTSMYLGAGNSMRFTFTVMADVPEGIY